MENLAGVTAYQAKYFAYALTREGGKGIERLQQSLLNASVDLNPHQVEAALFALRSPISKGALLADEVGLGKTIEAGLVMCQLWAEHKRKILVVCPAALRKQWQCELEDKFNLPCAVVDAKSARQIQREGFENPYSKPAVLISSYQFAARSWENIKVVAWDVVVMDEAHKLRNCYRESNKVGQALRSALEGRRKLLLTATPLQNSLVELYGISTLLDADNFGDLASFRSRFVNAGGDLDGLRERMREFCWRTLRKDVKAFVKYTDRLPLTESFACSDAENSLYEDVSRYLQDATTYAFPSEQRQMLTLVVRKVLASSTVALIGTLESILARLKRLRTQTAVSDEDLLGEIFADDPDLLEEFEEEQEEDMADDGAAGVRALPADDGRDRAPRDPQKIVLTRDDIPIDQNRLACEIDLVEDFIRRARAIGTDTKARHLLTALNAGWEKLRELGASEKAVVFTESRRSMNFLREYLEANGYGGEVVCFSGGGRKDATANEIYERYRAAHPEDNSSKSVMMRHALIEAFRMRAKILIATEAGAEGINLQFCSMVVNYDLPWNPQRVEQRIGRCHRYGQKYDVVVVNFCNTRNAADVRVYQLLAQKFQLFEGLFGASNDVLGIVDESGKSFERKIHDILQLCRTEAEITAAFDKLQNDLQEQIAAQRAQTCKDVLENLDDEVRAHLKIDPAFAQDTLNENESRFMALTRQTLGARAEFSTDDPRRFMLNETPAEGILTGVYRLKADSDEANVQSYRPNTSLGEWAIGAAKTAATPYAEVKFDITNYTGKLAVVEQLKGRRGYLRLERMTLKSLEQEDFLLFSAQTDDGKFLEPDIVEKMFRVPTRVTSGGHAGRVTLPDDGRDRAPRDPSDEGRGTCPACPSDVESHLVANAAQYAKATAAQVGEENNAHFKDATDKLIRWSEDQIAAATHKIETLRSRQLEIERSIRHARTLDEQVPLQKELDQVRKDIRRARVNVSTIEDETDEKRHRLLDALQKKLVPEVAREELFTIRWRVV